MHSSEDDSDFPARRRNNSRRQRDGSGFNVKFVFAPCYIVAFLLCFTKMKPRTRVMLTWFYTIICACVAGGLVVKYHNRNELTATPTDMRTIDMVSTTFCESVTIKSSAPIVTRKFFTPPTIGDSTYLSYFKVSTSLNSNQYQYWGFYLLKGSRVTAHVCGHVYLYKIVGKDKLDDWVDGARGNSFDGAPLLIDGCTSINDYQSTTEITATKSAQYYFLFLFDPSLSNAQFTNVNVDFVLKRKYYKDFSNVSTIICAQSLNCTVPLVQNSKQTVVVTVPYYRSLAEISVISHCEPRVFMYLIVFGLLPVIIGMLLTCIVLNFARKREIERERRNQNLNVFTVSGNDNGIDDGCTNPNFQLQLSPPSYDEVQASSNPSFTEQPPSYDEAVRNISNNNNNKNEDTNR